MHRTSRQGGGDEDSDGGWMTSGCQCHLRHESRAINGYGHLDRNGMQRAGGGNKCPGRRCSGSGIRERRSWMGLIGRRY